MFRVNIKKNFFFIWLPFKSTNINLDNLSTYGHITLKSVGRICTGLLIKMFAKKYGSFSPKTIKHVPKINYYLMAIVPPPHHPLRK